MRSTKRGRIGKTIAVLSWTSSKVTMSGIKVRERRPSRNDSEKLSGRVVDGGVKCSWTNCQTKMPPAASMAPATKNVPRIPMTWAITPPMTGPAAMPT